MELCDNSEILRNRFNFNLGLFLGALLYKNLWWELDGKFFAYGDLATSHVFMIQNRLNNEEIFQGWDEQHGTEFQQTNVPMIRIQKDNVLLHNDLVEETT